MFYVKAKVGKGSTIVVKLTDKNIYSKCPICGEEVRVNLPFEMKTDEDFSFKNSVAICPSCVLDDIQKNIDEYLEKYEEDDCHDH